MNWVRSNIRLGARLALVALAFQFVLSFGHVHAGVAQTTPVVASQIFDASAPSGDDHGPAGQTCDICAVMSLAQSVLSATPPALAFPQAVELLHLTTSAEFAHLVVLRGPFQPRAPPAS